MEHADIDDQAVLRTVIRAVEHVRRMRRGESVEEWHEAVADQLEEARRLLGSFGEGKALSRVVALSTQLLEWGDLGQVGVVATSEPPWKVLQGDLVDPALWGEHERRARTLKILKKLSQNFGDLPADAAVGPSAASMIDFCEERGILAATLRGRLRRRNERRSDENPPIRPQGKDAQHRLLYDRDDLRSLLTEEERDRCP